MCTLSSYSHARGAMLRQCDPVDVVQGLFKSRRNLSAASVLHTDEKTVGGRDRFLTWLKDIFNKSAEDKSHKADSVIVDRAATATTFNRPEIAASTRSADSSDKVDVINQKLANFCAVQSMTKFEYGNVRAEKRDAENGERAYAIQQSAIYATTSGRFAAGKTSERERDSDSSWRDPGKMYRSERNGGAIKLAARDDFDVASHYRCYTSPRHCYRLPPQRTKQPLLGLCVIVPNRYINVPTRAIVAFAPRNSKPPIKEPNAPEKPEKKDEKKDKREKKKPIIRTEGGESVSVDSSKNRAEMVADDNPRSDPAAATFRYEWGVKLAEERLPVDVNDNDKFSGKSQRYVTKRLWGVNLKHAKPDIAPPATANSEQGAERPQNASSISESGDSTTDGAKGEHAGTAADDSTEKSDASSLKGTTAEYLSTPTGSSDDDLIATQQDAGLYLSSEELRKIMRVSPNMLKETIVDNEFNIPEGAGLDTEITAWRNLMMRSDPEIKENYLSTDTMENLEMVSIRPEAPQPKLDVQVVRSTEDNETDREIKQPVFRHTSSKSVETKPVGSRRPGSYSIGKKLHTMSTQIRYVHQHMSSISQQHIELLPSNFASTNFFSTNPEDIKKAINEAPNQQNKRRMDSKSQNKESQTLSSSEQKQADADFAKTLDIIADKEMEISMQMNQLQSIDRKKIAPLSDSVMSSKLAQKNKSHYENVQDEVKHYERSCADYVGLHDEGVTFGNLSTDNGSIKLDAIKSAEEDSRSNDDDSITFDSNVKDVNDDSSKEYIIDGDYVRLPGDPYPYSKENLDKWRVPHSKNLVYKPWKRETSCSSDFPTVARSTLRNANDAYANIAGEPRDSHAGNAVMETSGSDGDGGASTRKRMRQRDGFRVSSRDQRVVSDCLRGDAADALGLRQWTEAFSRIDMGEKIKEAVRSDDNAYYE